MMNSSMTMGWSFVVLLLLVVGLVAALVAAWWDGTPRLRGSAAERILAERLARGEIEAEDYEQRLRALRAGGP